MKWTRALIIVVLTLSVWQLSSRVFSASAHAAPAGLIAAYGFNEGGGTTVTDLSGNGNSGAVSGATWTAAGRYGGALSFNGTNNLVTVNDANLLDLSNGMTLEAWVRPTTLSGWRTVILKERPSGLAYALYANTSANRPNSELETSNNSYEARGTAKLSLNMWAHLVATFDGATLRLFVNGAQVRSLAANGSITASSGPLRIGGNAVWGEYFAGQIDEIRIYNRALSQAEIQTDMTTPVGGAPTPDTTPPTVSLTGPANNGVVSGAITVSASASDNVGVAGVQFLLDGVNVGAEDLTAPYSVSWNTTTATNGSHTLTAAARDAAGNRATSSPITVTVSNGSDPSQVGAWSGRLTWPLVAVHATLLHTGKILLWDGWELPVAAARLWDPITQSFTAVPSPSAVFCAGHSMLADGRLLVIGGHDGGEIGIKDANIYDPATNQWTQVADMSVDRWYPSATTLGDGRVVALSGQITPGLFADTPEVYDPGSGSWSLLPVNTSSVQDDEYPLSYLLPNGTIYVIGATPGKVAILDVANQTWTNAGDSPVLLGTSVMYRPGKIMTTGGGDPSQSNQARTSTIVIDMNQSAPAWRQTAAMAFPRYEHNLVVLPDGKVLAVGGTSALNHSSSAGPLAVELWDPSTETWVTMSAMQEVRQYHSTALLLPDGRVLAAGGGRTSNATDHLTAEIYSPPYLFKGARPTISGAPSTAEYGTTIRVQTPDAASIASVALIRPGSVTHTLDMDQHYVELAFTRGAGELMVDIPVNPNLAPPGYYMLFLVNATGVPSTAAFVRMMPASGDSEPPTAPTNLTGQALAGAAGLSWTPAVDNVGVANYNIHRSTASGFIPSATNRIAQTSSTTYTDSGLAIGTYYFVVTARDGAGNVSTPSNQVAVNVVSAAPGGLVAAYSFNEGSGTTVTDLSGSGNSGTISGATWTAAGRFGGALSFNGSSSWVTVNDVNSLDLTTGMTVEAWVRPTALNGWRTVVLKERPGTLAYALYANMSANRPSGEVTIPDGVDTQGTGQLPLNTWSHLAVTYDGATLRLYVNGVQVSSRAAGGSIATSASPLRIGGNSVWGEYFAGQIDEIRIYNRARSQAEIQTDMNTPLSP
ncbi:MAG TPA: LamG-like jellyroll fold domain-containing protein [Methylomirabilota bacterium]|nr:LamG-like jellyroll fold domain-containing protein [Methylomirabilota bacterium]